MKIDDLRDGKETIIASGVVLEPLRNECAILAERVGGKRDVVIEESNRWLDDVMVVELKRQMRIVCRAHHLVDLLARADANNLVRDARTDRGREIDDLLARSDGWMLYRRR